MDFEKFRKDIIESKIKVDGLNVKIIEKLPENYNDMSRNELNHTRMINLICDILEEYDKRKNS
ncbi:hypothetical protein [Desulfuribacillus alkaliarsenatis]|uniref:Uncharacterized protein n=1 Tax=Desulfuribacillus alkaliarsenatis TaxID=766136 RepID=A0A1E5G2K3_9FIRM|nr:hypothetical protein [Desulfuribacillus alkaliarsenatis]OEF97225.1 hypothetical protein BHF68_14780 [Desulfuribacillus alkaliarsenatis]